MRAISSTSSATTSQAPLERNHDSAPGDSCCLLLAYQV